VREYSLKKSTENDFIDFIKMLSYNAIFNFVNTVRNVGKTTKAKAWRLAAFLKNQKKTIWVRTFEDDVKNTRKDFYTAQHCKAVKIVKNLGYDVDIKDISTNGNYIYYTNPKTKVKDWFIHIVHLSQAQALKGNEIANCNVIIYDEYATTISRVNRYIGNPAKDFLDLVISLSRDHYLRCILLGNKESYNNKFYDYLHIKRPPDEFEGIKTYKGGTILIYQLNHVPQVIEENTMNGKLKKALADTPMLGYLYDGKTQGINYSQIVKTPRNVSYAGGFWVKGAEFSLYYTYDGDAYFRLGLDKGQHVFTDSFTNKYKYSERLSGDSRKKLKMLVKAIKNNRVFFDNIDVVERVKPLLDNYIRT